MKALKGAGSPWGTWEESTLGKTGRNCGGGGAYLSPGSKEEKLWGGTIACVKALRQGQAWVVKEWKVGWRGVEGGQIREVGSASWPNQWRAFSWTMAWAGSDFQRSSGFHWKMV